MTEPLCLATPTVRRITCMMLRQKLHDAETARRASVEIGTGHLRLLLDSTNVIAAQGIEAAKPPKPKGSAAGESSVDKVDAPPSLPPTGEGLPEDGNDLRSRLKPKLARALLNEKEAGGGGFDDLADAVLDCLAYENVSLVSGDAAAPSGMDVAASLGRQLSAARARAERAESDAARFQALMRCGRIKMQGSAGVSALTGQRTYPDNPGMVHFGAEFWVEPEAELSPFTAWGRHCLRALADDILAFEAAGRAALSQGEETE